MTESIESSEIKGENDTSEKIEKDFIPHFFPTYRVKSKIYPVPIVIAVVFSGILAYLTYVEAGIQIDGGYVSEAELGPMAGILNGIIFTVVAAVFSFIIIFFVKKRGINILKYLFGFSFGLVGFFITLFFGQILIYLVFYNLPYSPMILAFYYAWYYLSFYLTGVFTFVIIYSYFTSKSVFTKNFLVLYIGLLIGAFMGAVMWLWTTLAILIGISLWDMFAVLYKRGPIKEMIEIASRGDENDPLEQNKLETQLKEGEVQYDTSKLEIGIGDIAFYSMLASSALIQTNNLLVMIFTSIAIIFGTGVTIMGLKRNKVLPGLPISIFLGIGVMLLSWFLFSLFGI